MTSKSSNHTQLKMKCLECGLHFVICTWYPEKHGVATAHCPECGQHDRRFIMWREESEDFIFQVVPGKAAIAGFGLPPDAQVEEAESGEALVGTVKPGMTRINPAAVSAEMRHGRNAPCPCGSGKRFKKCCMNGRT